MDNQATDSYLGYVFQAYYSLIVLLKASEDEAISIETQDDIELHGTETTLFQLKHSMGSEIPALSVKSENLWSTLRIWALSTADISKYILITCSPISNELSKLTSFERSEEDLNSLIACLDTEAERVSSERIKDPNKYKKKHKGCDAYLSLSLEKKISLIKRILIKPDHYPISQVESELNKILSTFIEKETRAKLVKRLLEWWNYRSVISLINENQIIEKWEIQDKILEIVSSISNSELPDIFGDKKPDDEELKDLPDNNIKKEIHNVDGGNARIQRALVSRWRARKQRDYWIQDRYCSLDELRKYDKKLYENWEERHSVIKEESYKEEEKIS